ncbi:NAC domain containing protein 50-like isoform X2 [Tripterygium wilfordii]|uniref:NAC domain containing protein 50-like isoform X2 n=1 Tax=Tripterygium wilfordii TaxID=458696 RepID=UPI0018F80742|nr:NAC domain containing protein 50-like isoform X2 [Tripterygium wilfordii]
MNDIVGFRFVPTDREIIDHYLRLKLLGDVHRVWAINEVNVFKHEPWDLCWRSAIQSDSMWHFFCQKDYKYARGERVNRTTDAGYWKKTGNDLDIKEGVTKQVIGAKKTLVFHIGRSPNGKKTNWVMNEFHPTFVPPGQRTFVLCRLEKKGGEENDGTPGVEHNAPSGSRNHVGDNTFSTPEVIGNTSLPIVTENGERVVDDKVFSPEVIRNASPRPLLTEKGNCVVENTVSFQEGNNSIEMYFKYLASVPLELPDTILSPASEFQVQETVAANNIQADNCIASNLEGAFFNSDVNIEGDDVNHAEKETQVDPFGTGNDSIIYHRSNGALSGGGSSIDQRTNSFDEFSGDWCMIDQTIQGVNRKCFDSPPWEPLDTIIPLDPEFQVQETVAPNDIRAENCLDNLGGDNGGLWDPQFLPGSVYFS